MYKKSIYEMHSEFVKQLLERGEKVLQPTKEKPYGTILGYVKGIKNPPAGYIIQDKDGTFGLYHDFFAHSYGNIKWNDIGLCDSRCWFEWRDSERDKRGMQDIVIIHKERPKTQVSAFLIIKKQKEEQKEEQILLSKRRNTPHYSGFYYLPVETVELDETLKYGIIRGAKYKLSIDIEPLNLKLIHIMHRKEHGEGEYECLDFFFTTDKYTGTIVNKDTEKCGELIWRPISDLPNNTVPYIKHAIFDITKNIHYSEYGW